jgi:hypothetical protein
VSGAGPDWDEGSPERLYVITGGRSASSARATLDLVTLIVSRSAPQPGMQPEHAAILRMCQYPLSVAEISAYLRLQFSVTAILVADLLADERAEARAPITATSLPDPELLKAVIYGLSKL